jgi:acetyl-CoA acetyltransferase
MLFQYLHLYRFFHSKLLIFSEHRSQQTWAAAAEAGVFADEIVPIKMKSKKVGILFLSHSVDKVSLNALSSAMDLNFDTFFPTMSFQG